MSQIFRDYTIFSIAAGELNNWGVPSYMSAETINQTTVLIDSKNKRHLPYNKDQISSDATMMMEFLEVYFAQLLGDLGENIVTCVFAGDIIDPLKNEDFRIILNKKTFTYDLPLGSLLPPKYCSKCRKSYNGRWSFCPFTGNYLR